MREELTLANSAISCHIDRAAQAEGEGVGVALRRSQLLKLSPSPTHQESLLPGDSLREECELPRQPLFFPLRVCAYWLGGDSGNAQGPLGSSPPSHCHGCPHPTPPPPQLRRQQQTPALFPSPTSQGPQIAIRLSRTALHRTEGLDLCLEGVI